MNSWEDVWGRASSQLSAQSWLPTACWGQSSVNQGSSSQEGFWEPSSVSEALVAQDTAGMHEGRIGPWLAGKGRTGLQVLCSAKGASAFHFLPFFIFSSNLSSELLFPSSWIFLNKSSQCNWDLGGVSASSPLSLHRLLHSKASLPGGNRCSQSDCVPYECWGLESEPLSKYFKWRSRCHHGQMPCT